MYSRGQQILNFHRKVSCKGGWLISWVGVQFPNSLFFFLCRSTVVFKSDLLAMNGLVLKKQHVKQEGKEGVWYGGDVPYQKIMFWLLVLIDFLLPCDIIFDNILYNERGESKWNVLVFYQSKMKSQTVFFLKNIADRNVENSSGFGLTWDNFHNGRLLVEWKFQVWGSSRPGTSSAMPDAWLWSCTILCGMMHSCWAVVEDTFHSLSLVSSQVHLEES